MLIDDIATNLEANLSLFATFKIDVLSDDNNALTIRRYTSGQTTKFIDKSRDDILGIQILVKNTDQGVSADTIEKINDYLVNLDNLTSSDNSYTFVSCDVYIQPLLVEKTDHGSYLYQAMYQVKIHKN